ncbi:MAG: YidC/Oxa1 family membrane protein insertase [Solirubrobacterales bacterium]|nr:YidC/Oxa1 family membrane protein insertase [Solirubrobacterales bacterium]
MTSLALIQPLQFIVDTLRPVLEFFHDSVGLGWGMSIVMLTVCVRALLVPLTVKQFKSMQSMARVAPELKALQSKYKGDKQRQQQEVMKFYQQNKINPFASCLPLLLQLPFFLGLFYLLQGDLRNEICGQTAKECGKVVGANGSEKFLFIPDLTAAATGGVLAALIVLYIGSQLISSVLMTVTADKNQRRLMIALPFVFTVFIISFPAGLIVYWITTNLWTVGQQYIVRKTIGPIVPLKTGDDGAAADSGGLLATLTGSKNGKADEEKVPAGVGARTPSGPPPRSPRKKKKRSGRRR